MPILLLTIMMMMMIIIIDNFCIALFSGVPKLIALYKILQHFLSFTNIILIILTADSVLYTCNRVYCIHVPGHTL